MHLFFYYIHRAGGDRQIIVLILHVIELSVQGISQGLQTVAGNPRGDHHRLRRRRQRQRKLGCHHQWHRLTWTLNTPRKFRLLAYPAPLPATPLCRQCW